MTHKPATELPWHWQQFWNGDYMLCARRALIILQANKGKLRVRNVAECLMVHFNPEHPDMAYLIHAANAYPKLVAAMKDGSKAAIEAALKDCGEL